LLLPPIPPRPSIVEARFWAAAVAAAAAAEGADAEACIGASPGRPASKFEILPC
jgi:hypothetical protein